MPTPVSIARQCLAADSVSALDAAVSAARRRNHAQTTSLHVVFALLSSSSSSPSLLRDAVSRARSSAYSPRLQFKALEYCFSVALDRLPSSLSHHPPAADDPPVSNSLMAAVKRSQAHQRRNPDTFQLYNQQQTTTAAASSASSFAGVKVELQQLVLAILDDPVVSRVFGEAGFRSCDIKLAVLRPPIPILRFPRCPPLFLCNFSSDVSAGPRGFPFPFPAADGGDENCRRIGEVLARGSGRNPILVGVGAADAAQDFAHSIADRNWANLPPEIRGIKLVSIERELLADGGPQSIRDRIEELSRQAEEPGLVVCIGDLKVLVEGEERCGPAVSCLVSELTRALELHNGRRLWVMGWSATYEAYMKLLSRYPLLDKDWALQLLPITSLRPTTTAAPQPRPHSLMESFVPFGGFFPAAYESKGPLSKPQQPTVRCQECNDKYEQELAAILKGSSTPVEDQHQPAMPAWLRKSDMMNDGSDSTKAKDDKSLLSSKVMELQKKWNDNCQRGCEVHELDKDHNVGLQCVSEKDKASNQTSKNPSSFPMPVDLQKITKGSQSVSLPLISEPKDQDLISKLQARLSKSEELQTEGFRSELCVQDDLASPSSVTSVTTDLVLGIVQEPLCNQEKPSSLSHTNYSGSLPLKKVDEFSRIVTEVLVQPMMKVTAERFDANNFKAFYTSLIEKVGRQEESVSAIAKAIVRCRTGHERRDGARFKGDIWLNFLGPDRVGKKRVALALAELVFGSSENLVSIDLGYEDKLMRTKTICNQQENDGYDVRFRGKTVVDHIASEVSKNPESVVLLENIERADFMVQNSLSRAIETGKFPDSHGREFSINNAIFVTTAKEIQARTSFPPKKCINFSEERILEAQGWQMKMIWGPAPEITRIGHASVFISKRKLDFSDAHEESYKRSHKRPSTFLDLNVPVDEIVASDPDDSSLHENNLSSDYQEAWIEEFSNSIDDTIDFKPFDFDALADYVLKEVNKSFHSTIGSGCLLEIDVEVMEQILAATWLAGNTGELNHWLETVVARSFVELRQRHNSSSCTIVRLAACEGVPMDRAPGILLPLRIILE